MGYSQLVMDQLDTQSPLHDEMSEVVQAGRRAADMTARLLSFGRRQPVNVRTIDVNPVIQETEHLLQHTLEDNIELTTLLGDDLGGVMIDEGHLQQLVMNLVINARDSMPAGGRIVVETSRHNRTQPDGHMIPEMAPGEYVCLTVSDSGSGMTDEVREHIFEPFFTTKEKEKGSGLGLAIVYGLVKQSNGHIRVISQPGQGSVFEIYFPRQHQVSSPEAPTPQEHLRRGHETVLVVEDEKSVRHFAVNVFKSLGYRTLQAGNGNEAMLIFNKFGGEIDLLFTDIVMPGMNGHELVNCLREHGYHFRALYASGFSGDLLDDPHAEAKIPLLSKPYTRDELGRMIACVFETQ
jgi:CheY-like chemotaxis protein